MTAETAWAAYQPETPFAYDDDSERHAFEAGYLAATTTREDPFDANIGRFDLSDPLNAFCTTLPEGSPERDIAIAAWIAATNYAERGTMPAPYRREQPFAPLIMVTPATVGSPEGESAGLREQMRDRLITAVEGECDGLALSISQAETIVAYQLNGDAAFTTSAASDGEGE